MKNPKILIPFEEYKEIIVGSIVQSFPEKFRSNLDITEESVIKDVEGEELTNITRTWCTMWYENVPIEEAYLELRGHLNFYYQGSAKVM